MKVAAALRPIVELGQRHLSDVSIGPGTRFGKYTIVEPVGTGGMGEVWRARDPELERDVAIKVLPASFADDEATGLVMELNELVPPPDQ